MLTKPSTKTFLQTGEDDLVELDSWLATIHRDPRQLDTDLDNVPELVVYCGGG